MIPANPIYSFDNSEFPLLHNFTLNQEQDEIDNNIISPNLKSKKKKQNKILNLAKEMMKKEIYNNNFIKKINKNLLSSHKIYFCEECSLTPFLSLKYERNEKNNFYNVFINYSCDNNHENKVEITQFFQKSVKNKISKDKNPEFELSKYNKIKQKIESFSYNIKLIKEIGNFLEKRVKELNELIKLYEQLNNLEFDFTNLLLDCYKNENIDERINDNIIQLLNFNENILELEDLEEMELIEHLFLYLNSKKNFFLKENELYSPKKSSTSTKFSSDSFIKEIKNLEKYKVTLHIKENIKKIVFLNEETIIMINKSTNFFDIIENKLIFKIVEKKEINDLIKLKDNLILLSINDIMKIYNINLTLCSYQLKYKIKSHKSTVNKLIILKNGFISCSEDSYYKIFQFEDDNYMEKKSVKAHNKGITSILVNDCHVITASYGDKNIKSFNGNIIKILNVICYNCKDCLFNAQTNLILLFGVDKLYLINLDKFIVQRTIHDFEYTYMNFYENSIIVGDTLGYLIQFFFKENEDFMIEKNMLKIHDNKINYIIQFNDYIISSSIDGNIQILFFQ
jgi:hypothetical protein